MKYFPFLLGLVFSLGLSSIAHTQGIDLSEYYPLNTDDLWVYEVVAVEQGQEDVVTCENMKVLKQELPDGRTMPKLSYGDGSYLLLLVEQDGVKIYRRVDDDMAYEAFSPPLMLIPFELESDGEFQGTYAYEEYDGEGAFEQSGNFNINLKFEKLENVTVPAGDFKGCVKISGRMVKDNEGVAIEILDYSIWLAKGVGIVRELINEIEYDLDEGSSFATNIDTRLMEAVIGGVKSATPD